MNKGKKTLDIACVICFCVFAFLMCLKNSINGDTYFMLSHGRWIFNNGLYPQEEMLTMHVGLHFTFQKWLICIILYGLYCVGGEVALRCFMGLCMAAFIILLKYLLNMVNKNYTVNNLFILVSSIIIAHNIVASPRIITYILLVLELIFLEKYKNSKDNYKYLIPIPLLTCLDMNFHSTQVIIMFIFMLPYIFDLSFIKFKNKKLNSLKNKYIVKENYKRKNIVIIFIISIFSLLINPYGFESILYIVNSLTFSEYNSIILELQHTPFTALIFSTIVWIFPFLVMLLYKKKIHLIYVYFLIGTIFMYAMHQRNFSYAAIACALSGTYFIGNILDKYNKKKYAAIIFVFILLFSSFISISSIAKIRSDYILSGNRIITPLAIGIEGIDNAIKDYLHQKYPDEDINDVVARTKVYFYPSGGSYMEFLGYKSFVDCRSEVFYKSINKKEDIQLDYYNLIKGKINYKDFFKKYPVDIIITTPKGADAIDLFEDDLLKDNDYKLICTTEVHKVFVPIK